MHTQEISTKRASIITHFEMNSIYKYYDAPLMQFRSLDLLELETPTKNSLQLIYFSNKVFFFH